MAFSYASGNAGTVNVPAGNRVNIIQAYSFGGGSLTINGGSSIPIPSQQAFEDNYAANGEIVEGPMTIVFNGTNSFYVRWCPG
jgi:hypothetical protein